MRAEQHNPGEERERPVAGKRKPESEDVNQSSTGVWEDNGGLEVKGPRGSASLCIIWGHSVSISGMSFTQLKNAKTGLD